MKGWLIAAVVGALWLLGRQRREDRSFAEIKLADSLEILSRSARSAAGDVIRGAGSLWNEGHSITGGELPTVDQELVDQGKER